LRNAYGHKRFGCSVEVHEFCRTVGNAGIQSVRVGIQADLFSCLIGQSKAGYCGAKSHELVVRGARQKDDDICVCRLRRRRIGAGVAAAS